MKFLQLNFKLREKLKSKAKLQHNCLLIGRNNENRLLHWKNSHIGLNKSENGERLIGNRIKINEKNSFCFIIIAAIIDHDSTTPTLCDFRMELASLRCRVISQLICYQNMFYKTSEKMSVL